MRHIADRLDRTLKRLAANFIERQCQQQRCREAKEDLVTAQQNRIGQHAFKLCAIKKRSKVPQSDPVAAPHAQTRRVILECNQRPVHRRIVEHKIVGKDWNQHPYQVFIAFVILLNAPDPRHMCIQGCRLLHIESCVMHPGRPAGGPDALRLLCVLAVQRSLHDFSCAFDACFPNVLHVVVKAIQRLIANHDLDRHLLCQHVHLVHDRGIFRRFSS